MTAAGADMMAVMSVPVPSRRVTEGEKVLAEKLCSDQQMERETGMYEDEGGDEG